MKKSVAALLAAAFVFGTGFLGQNEDGGLSVDTSDLSAQTAEAMSVKALEKAMKAAESIKVSSEEILADLDKPMDVFKQKVAGMDAAKLIAYLNQYSGVMTGTQKQIADYTAQIKEMKWTQKFGAKGKELKKQMAAYTDRFNLLKEQCSLYIDKLKSLGIDPAACGIDLSAFGL